jgi:glycosyl transferase family 4
VDERKPISCADAHPGGDAVSGDRLMTRRRVPARNGRLRVAFDSRPASQAQGVGDYTRSLLAALLETASADTEIVEMRRPMGGRLRRVDVFHTPWMEGAALRSPCPTVVTLHDVDALMRRSERLRGGGVHARLRHLALQRATRVIVHDESMAHDAHSLLGLERERLVVIPQAAPGDQNAGATAATISQWCWQDVARATWSVYEQAHSAPLRPLITRPRVA